MCSDAGGVRGVISIPTYFSVWISSLTINQGLRGCCPPKKNMVNNPQKIKKKEGEKEKWGKRKKKNTKMLLNFLIF